eukprot:CAMPEP_0177344788 /NCGR_PEP_ID=MMETSP0368-20130122/28296_1 /TAXON_ID=447022 ORGANISM="Scrippsiella hangoei-like, Strain SHHI-4" /NCGR_SAMPLE_ID=MMETSP0368 /ASSEMBLY_ACC=CAM_ASM_000363 /LENGTH=408 /DNA_ID=CAMNT_0018806311 /DNA_START=72 /DNA_END=1299 /DNA_ORIENTATION=+
MSWGVQKHWLKQGGDSSGGWGGASTRKAEDCVPDGYEVDSEARYTGTVKEYWKWQGYGFIMPGAGCPKVPKDKLYVHWGNIQTEDRYPFLLKDMEVEFTLAKQKEAENKYSLRARTVTQTGGASIEIQDLEDAKKKTWVGSQTARYTGVLKFYSPEKQLGFLKLDEGQAVDKEVPSELKVEEAEMNCGGKRPHDHFKDIKVEFGIVKSKNGTCVGYNVSLPGGKPMTREVLENRTSLGVANYQGKVQFWNHDQGWGHIVPDALGELPKEVQGKLVELKEEASKKRKDEEVQPLLYFRKADAKGFWPKKDAVCTFQLYSDEKASALAKLAGPIDAQEGSNGGGIGRSHGRQGGPPCGRGGRSEPGGGVETGAAGGWRPLRKAVSARRRTHSTLERPSPSCLGTSCIYEN